MRVLYVTGWCRTGSTLLGNVLGELDAVAHVGELAYLRTNGVLGSGTNTTCGCGTELADCPVWSEVFSRLHPGDGHGGDGDGDARAQALERVRLHAAHLRTRHTRARLAEARGRARPDPEVAGLLRRMVDDYTTIAEVLDAGVVVDSSKFPAEAAALCGLPELDARVLHLIRDPRATAYSWRRAKDYIPAMGVARSTAYWTGFNLASELISDAFPERCLRVRYEDFAARPAELLAEIAAWAGLPDSPLVAGDGTVTLGTNHTVTGNPDRLRRGPIRIRPDQAWVDGLPAREAAISTSLALPLLPRYRYRLLGRR